MESIELIRKNLRHSEEIVLARIDDMREHGFVAPTPHGGCHTVWTLGHLAVIESLAVDEMMQGVPMKYPDWRDLFDGAEVSQNADDYPPFEEALAACRQTRASTLELIEGLSEEQLDQRSASVPESVEDLFGTYRACLQYVANHWFMHRGQLADARRAAGLERAWF